MSALLPRTVFAGTGQFVLPVLETVLATTDLRLIITQPQANDAAVSEFATKHNLPVKTPERISELKEQFVALAPDVLVVASYGQIIPSAILQIPKHGALNIHPSLLPKHRGPAPVPAAILAGDKKTGVTIIQMDNQMDHGPILAQTEYPLTGQEKTPELLTRLWQQGAKLLATTIIPYCSGEQASQTQNETAASTHRLLNRQHGQLMPTDTVTLVDRKWRAYLPWPGVWLHATLRGRQRMIKIIELLPWTEQVPELPPLTFFWKNGKLGVRLVDGAVAVRALQVEGSSVMAGEAFYRGYHDEIIDG